MFLKRIFFIFKRLSHFQTDLAKNLKGRLAEPRPGWWLAPSMNMICAYLNGTDAVTLPEIQAELDQCNFTVGLACLVIARATVCMIVLMTPCMASSCSLYSDRYIIFAKYPSSIRFFPTTPPIKFPTVEYLPSDTNDPKSRYL